MENKNAMVLNVNDFKTREELKERLTKELPTAMQAEIDYHTEEIWAAKKYYDLLEMMSGEKLPLLKIEILKPENTSADTTKDDRYEQVAKEMTEATAKYNDSGADFNSIDDHLIKVLTDYYPLTEQRVEQILRAVNNIVQKDKAPGQKRKEKVQEKACTRQSVNRDILNRLFQINDVNPGLRFTQLLSLANITVSEDGKPEHLNYYEEPSKTLKRVDSIFRGLVN